MSTDTLTDNELIAEFMGMEFKKEIEGIKYYSVPSGHTASYNASMGQFYYHKSWDWLMPVVEKIESLGYYTNIFRDEDGQQTAILHPVPSYNRDESSMIVPNDPMRGNKSKIDTTYKAVVEFIKWYNQQPK